MPKLNSTGTDSNDDDLEVFRSAKCAVFAAALSEMMGYEILVITTPFYVLEGGEPEDDVFDEERHNEEKSALTHVFCVSGDVAIDVDGARPLTQMVERWTHGGIEGQHFYIKQCENIQKLCAYTTVFLPDGLVALARTAIKKNPAKYRA